MASPDVVSRSQEQIFFPPHVEGTAGYMDAILQRCMFQPLRSDAMVPSPHPTGLGTNIRFEVDAKAPVYKDLGNPIHFVMGGGQSFGYATTGITTACIDGESVVIADAREEETTLLTTSAAAIEFGSCFEPPEEVGHAHVAQALYAACEKLELVLEEAYRPFEPMLPSGLGSAEADIVEDLRLPTSVGSAVLVGSVLVGDTHYIFNHSGAMVFLLQNDGRVVCLTDYVLPDHPQFEVPGGAVTRGEIVYADRPIRCLPRVNIGGKMYHSARGLGYPEEISSKPLVTYLSKGERGKMGQDVRNPIYEEGDCLLYVTQDGTQNIQRNEVETAWNQLLERRGVFKWAQAAQMFEDMEDSDLTSEVEGFCKHAASAIAYWVTRRAVSPQLGVVIKQL